MATATVRIGIDVGGTFTDFVAVRDETGELFHLKEPSTPSDPSDAVISGLSRLIDATGITPGDIASISHGTTIGLNAIIQRRGADIALVISRGHRDVLELTRRLPREYDLRQPRIAPLVPRDRVFEIDARLDAHGGVVWDPDEAEIARVAGLVRASGAEAVALTVLHSYLDPAYERGVADRLSAALGDIPVSPSSDIWPEIREYNRTSVVALNSYITPLMHRYLTRLRERLTGLGVTGSLYVTASNGGSLSVDAAIERPVDTILSGPASGVTATLLLAAETGLQNLISFDMGGTSSDIAVAVTGEAEFANRTEVGGLPLIMPVVDVNAIGAGGGSIARIDEQGLLRVGPESAGATPGPAAYGSGGTQATVTDAYLVTGIIDPEEFLGGDKKLDVQAAADAMGPIATGLGLEGTDAAVRAAAGVLTLATVGMAAELQKVLARQGYDPAEFTLVPFGGAGPTHAALLASEAGIRSIVVPLAAGTYCALGAVGADLRRDYLRGIGRPLDGQIAALASEYLAELRAGGERWVAAQGEAVVQAQVRLFLEIRYLGQAFELDVDIDPNALPLDAAIIAELFHAKHEEVFGHRDAASDIIVIAAKATALGSVQPVGLGTPPAAAPALARTRRVWLDDAWHDAVVLGEGDLAELDQRGPAVIDLPHTTIVVPPGWHAVIAPGNSVRITR